MPSKRSAPKGSAPEEEPKRLPPVRRTPLDGVEPRDFATKGWPNSPIHLPQQVREYGLSEDQLKELRKAVNDWRDLIIDYERFVVVSHSKHGSMARRMGVSEGTLRALRRGDQFPSFRVQALMRGLVPDPEKLDRLEARGQFLSDEDPTEQTPGRRGSVRPQERARDRRPNGPGGGSAR